MLLHAWVAWPVIDGSLGLHGVCTAEEGRRAGDGARRIRVGKTPRRLVGTLSGRSGLARYDTPILQAPAGELLPRILAFWAGEPDPMHWTTACRARSTRRYGVPSAIRGGIEPHGQWVRPRPESKGSEGVHVSAQWTEKDTHRVLVLGPSLPPWWSRLTAAVG